MFWHLQTLFSSQYTKCYLQKDPYHLSPVDTVNPRLHLLCSHKAVLLHTPVCVLPTACKYKPPIQYSPSAQQMQFAMHTDVAVYLRRFYQILLLQKLQDFLVTNELYTITNLVANNHKPMSHLSQIHCMPLIYYHILLVKKTSYYDL